MKPASLDIPQEGLGVQEGWTFAYPKLLKDRLVGYNPWITFLSFLKTFFNVVLSIVEKFDAKPNFLCVFSSFWGPEGFLKFYLYERFLVYVSELLTP